MEKVPIKCKYCTREFHSIYAIRPHEKLCPYNPNRKEHPRGMKGRKPWHSGLTKETDERVRIKGEKVSSVMKGKKGIIHSDKTKSLLSNIAKINHYGGYIPGSGRGKKGWYKNFWCDSSWELAFILYCIDMGLSVERCREKREYFFEGNSHIYHPDFLIEGQIIEIKGFNTPQVEAKKRHNKDILFLYKEDMAIILDYILIRYGKNFIDLYEGDKLGRAGPRLENDGYSTKV